MPKGLSIANREDIIERLFAPGISGSEKPAALQEPSPGSPDKKTAAESTSENPFNGISRLLK